MSEMEQNKPGGHTILVAEDDVANFQYIHDTFKASGLTILHALNGKEAIELCENHPEIRLVMMDVMMPVMSGFRASQEIRKIRPDVPIIILTAYVSQESIRDAVLSGCNDYFAKPIGPEELRTVLKKWLIG